MSRVEFVSYTGKYPCLCHGILTVRIEGKEVQFNDFVSGGYVVFDKNWNEEVGKGPWSIKVPAEYAEYAQEIEDCMNANVPLGCCGGCV